MLLIILCIGIASLAGCSAAPGTATDRSISVNEQAALEATAIIQRAEATALVLQAQAKATALIQNASAPPAAPATARVIEAARAPTPSSAASQATEVRATPGMTATDNASLSRVELLRVDFAAEGRYIHVEFRAPPRVARKWRQGNVSVIDEATATTYDGIPVAPIIGPLIAQPIHDGQIGYVMLVNVPPGLHPGSIVTVVLGDFRQEHVTVSGGG